MFSDYSLIKVREELDSMYLINRIDREKRLYIDNCIELISVYQEIRYR